ncbi:hypothetical protein BV210_09690 [Halorientalis sp. IM1011]|uniref:winged helix-turn-helix domain-containing protein n=1 Tax=Halorientalis sp. IM1011 TaxID=1932360 RepID=UPI00097CD17E|nr:winged helix-turn-helix domain-containing protein [Halorientalis sp. IM1011]AQL42970.1 hypothetical protein BV210_09690 [Halorientalis sp. IM1011]
MAAQRAANGHLEHLLDLSTIVFEPERAFAERLAAALELESQHLDLPYGFLSYIDREAGRQEIVLTTGMETVVEEGETIPLSETYCRKTIATEEGRLAVDAAGEEGWAGDPAYERFGLESYVGSAVEFDGDRRGTVCLAGEEARDEPLGEFEVELVGLLARWASYELAHRTGRTESESDRTQLATFTEPVDATKVDTALDLLADRTRRELLPYLATVDGPISVTEAAAYLANTSGVPGQKPERVEIALVHSHVPKLVSAGVVDYDESDRKLDYRASDGLERLLNRVRTLEG